MKGTLSIELGGIIPHQLTLAGSGRKPAELRRSLKKGAGTLMNGTGKGNRITGWLKDMLGNGQPKERCPRQNLFGQDQTYQGMHLSLGY